LLKGLTFYSIGKGRARSNQCGSGPPGKIVSSSSSTLGVDFKNSSDDLKICSPSALLPMQTPKNLARTTLVVTRGIICSVRVSGGNLLDDSDTASGTAGAPLLRAPSTHSCWPIWLVLSKRGLRIRVSLPRISPFSWWKGEFI
jgi:hypothetical protein